MIDLSPLRIRIFATGGTIDKVYFDATSSYEIGEPQIGALLKEANVTFEFEVESLMRKDSLELSDSDRQKIRQHVESAEETRILITHGTDTMTETAAALDDIPGKTVVFTGSMLPAKFRQNDALFNVGCAVGAVQTLPQGVYVAMNGCLFPAGSVRKNSEERRFEPITEK